MSDDLADFIIAYINGLLPDIKVYDAKYPFSDTGDYATFYIPELYSNSPHKNLISTTIDTQNETKTKSYKELFYVDALISFKGANCRANMKLFRDSFITLSSLEAFNESETIGFYGKGKVIDVSEHRNTYTKEAKAIEISFSVADIAVDTVSLVKSATVELI